MLRNPFGIALVAYYLFMAIVGMLVPDDILTSHAWAREFSDFMASIAPQIDRVTALNIKPDVNRFYFSVLWAGSPVSLYLCLSAIWRGRQNADATMWRMPLKTAVLWCCFYLAIVCGAQFGYWMTDTTNRQLLLFLNNGVGRGFWGSVVYVHGTSIFAAILFLITFGWLTGYIPSNIKRNRNV
nr:hypothetical protein [uncultured Rhodoferax sp.]